MNWLGCPTTTRQPVKPDDHSEVVPLLPIPNRTVKRLCADDSAGSRVKVGHCQANIRATARASNSLGVLLLGSRKRAQRLRPQLHINENARLAGRCHWAGRKPQLSVSSNA